jgi:hypothetical protein
MRVRLIANSIQARRRASQPCIDICGLFCLCSRLFGLGGLCAVDAGL